MIQFTSKIFSMNMANDHEICHACVLLCRLLACFVTKYVCGKRREKSPFAK